MKKKVFNCLSCGDVPMALLDGYHFGDRLLEGVMFEIRIVNDQCTATIRADAAAYMANLNEAKWLREAADCANTYDVFECPTCGGEVIQESPF